jgi:ATP-dependent exoDNAse (exonuclease V) beta subunit
MREHISFSELKIWNECPYKHKLVYKDKIKQFLGNEYTAFGTAIHHVCENLALNKSNNMLDEFNYKFIEELRLLTEKKVQLKKDLVQDMRKQAENILKFVLPSLKKTFSNFEVVSVEEELYIPIENSNMMFKGFIDLVIKTPDGKYHVIDWKTCSWGWDSKKKADRITSYQITLYKKFFAAKHNLDPKNIETYFALLKRTAKSNNVEIFRVTSGPKKTDNALNLLNKAVYNISKDTHIKNRLSCTSGFGCEFYNTEHCR